MNWRSILKQDKDIFAFDEDGKPMTLEEWSNKEENDDQIYQQNLRGNAGSKWESLKRNNFLRREKKTRDAIVQFLEDIESGKPPFDHKRTQTKFGMMVRHYMRTFGLGRFKEEYDKRMAEEKDLDYGHRQLGSKPPAFKDYKFRGQENKF